MIGNLLREWPREEHGTAADPQDGERDGTEHLGGESPVENEFIRTKMGVDLRKRWMGGSEFAAPHLRRRRQRG